MNVILPTHYLLIKVFQCQNSVSRTFLETGFSIFVLIA